MTVMNNNALKANSVTMYRSNQISRIPGFLLQTSVPFHELIIISTKRCQKLSFMASLLDLGLHQFSLQLPVLSCPYQTASREKM